MVWYLGLDGVGVGYFMKEGNAYGMKCTSARKIHIQVSIWNTWGPIQEPILGCT
jgi:hypothetical protein